MVNQVGSPAMFDGNMFLPDTGTPIWKIERISTVLAVWLPDPFTVATCKEKSLTTLCPGSLERGSAGDTSNVDIYDGPCCVKCPFSPKLPLDYTAETEGWFPAGVAGANGLLFKS